MDSRLKRLVSEYASLSSVTFSSGYEVSQKWSGETWRDRDEGIERGRDRDRDVDRGRDSEAETERERESGEFTSTRRERETDDRQDPFCRRVAQVCRRRWER